MSAPPGVSVVIPAYNYARFLPRAIESALTQSHSPFEIIVVDDGSTDDTQAVVARYTGPRVRCVHQQNAGLSAARNTGIREARFPYVAFLDADDEWRPDFLAACIAAFQKLGGEFGIVACGAERIDAAGAPLDTKTFSLDGDFEITARDLIVRTRFMPSAVVARRDIFQRCGFFDTTLRSSEDRDMWIRAAARWRIHFIGKILVRVRKHSANMSRNAGRMKQNIRRVLAKAFQNRAVPRWDAPFWLRVLAVHFFQIAWTHYEEGRRVTAIRYVVTSLLLWPFFLHPRALNEPALFRLRALARFAVQ
jgi:glycosyltransferase involved in cell wall biosynthesis